ncbi:MAG: HupE/UreJ family protein [Gammaproteobacteria bacterium]
MIAALMFGAATRAEAHFTSTSYLTADDSIGGDVRITWDVSAADFHWSLGLDRDGDGAITWEEIQTRRDDIASFALEHLRLGRGGQACDTHFTDLLLTTHAQEPHLSLEFRALCEKPGALSLSGTLFFDTNTTQRTLISAVTPVGEFTSILSPDSPRWTEPAAPSVLATFATFVGQGLWHVWIGYDHLAFLLLLLLPGVLRAVGAGWEAVPTFRETARDLFRIITAFTLAHSLTLALAATGTVSIPVRPVEVTIAASIVIAGLLNLFPRAARARLALAFGFGLVHGFGFANALAELGARGARLVPALAGFNIGVELAQLSLVLLVLPFLFRARTSAFYAWRFMPAASLVAAMAGAAWLVARVNV